MQEDQLGCLSIGSAEGNPLTPEDVAAVVAKMEERNLKGTIKVVWRHKSTNRDSPCSEKIVTSDLSDLKHIISYDMFSKTWTF